MLKRLLDKSKGNVSNLKDPHFNLDNEKTFINATIIELESLILEFFRYCSRLYVFNYDIAISFTNIHGGPF